LDKMDALTGSNWARALCTTERYKKVPDEEMKAAMAASLADSAKPTSHLDISVVCHEVRGLDLAAGRQAYVSVHDVSCHEVSYTRLGMVSNLRTLEIDTALSLRICEGEVDEVSYELAARGSGDRRVLGEARLPLRHLVQQYNSCLYYTWIALEDPGLNNSITSLGDFANDNGASALDQAIAQAPKQLSQARACISICRSSDVGRTGKIIWTHDAPPEARNAWWGPLLRSQQQHVVLSAALHLKCDRDAHGPVGSDPSQILLGLQSSSHAQSDENERLKAELEIAQSQLREQRTQHQQAMTLLEAAQSQLQQMQQSSLQQTEQHERIVTMEKGSSQTSQVQFQAQTLRLAELETRLAEATATHQKMSERLRAAQGEAEEARAELLVARSNAQNLELELDTIGSEANEKIEGANDRIRTLRHRKEEADQKRTEVEQELQMLHSSTIPMLAEEKATLEAENWQLSEQKEALLRIVEDLHMTCKDAGLNTAGRRSIDNSLRNIGCSTTTIAGELRTFEKIGSKGQAAQSKGQAAPLHSTAVDLTVKLSGPQGLDLSFS